MEPKIATARTKLTMLAIRKFRLPTHEVNQWFHPGVNQNHQSMADCEAGKDIVRPILSLCPWAARRKPGRGKLKNPEKSNRESALAF
jgi:hypothetical protein